MVSIVRSGNEGRQKVWYASPQSAQLMKRSWSAAVLSWARLSCSASSASLQYSFASFPAASTVALVVVVVVVVVVIVPVLPPPAPLASSRS